MGEDLTRIAFVVLGFLLGLLGSFGQERFRRALDRQEFKTAIVSELYDLRLRLAFVAFHVRRVQLNVDHAFLRWLKPLCVPRGADHHDTAMVSRLIDQLLLADEQEVRALIQRFNNAQPPDQSGSFKKCYAPVLASKIGTLGSLPAALQALLVDIDARLRMFNEEVDRAFHFLDLTFTATGENHLRARANIESAERMIGKQAEIICDAISKVGDLQGT